VSPAEAAKAAKAADVYPRGFTGNLPSLQQNYQIVVLRQMEYRRGPRDATANY